MEGFGTRGSGYGTAEGVPHMTKNVNFSLLVSGEPWTSRTLSYSVTLGQSEAQQLHDFLCHGVGEVDVKGPGGTRLIGWPTTDLEGMDLCALTLMKQDEPMMFVAMDRYERAVTADTLARARMKP